MKNVLFLCTGNSARSVMAESWLNHIGDGEWRAYSAGSQPTGTPNPFALQTLELNGVTPESGDGGDIRSKSWDEFAEADAPLMDVVITVCDNAAEESCPIWPTKPGGDAPVKLHWGFPDPAGTEGSDEEKLASFQTVFTGIRAQINEYVNQES